MPCTPLSLDNISPGPGIGGLVPQLPTFDLPFPSIPMEDLQALFDQANLILPAGIMHPSLTPQIDKTFMDAVRALLGPVLPALLVLSMLMAVVQMIFCIIEVLCAINNPFKLVRALIRLFRVCIPAVLALVPSIAMILLIISLLLLLLALILYLIERIIDLIKQLIANIKLLADAISSADNDSVIAITTKLGNLLCILQNLFVIFGVIAIIVQVIKAMLEMTFKIPPCDDSDGSDDGCCTPDVCPSFIKNVKEINRTTGTIQSLGRVIKTGETDLVRPASIQFWDASNGEFFAFNNIVHAWDLPEGVSKVFFPDGKTYTSSSVSNTVPYTVDLRFWYDPGVFGRTEDLGAKFHGVRLVRVKDCIVTKAPSDGVLDYNGNLVEPFNGTLFLTGGIAYEDDGTTFIRLGGDAAANLDQLVGMPDLVGVSPALVPGLTIGSVEWTFKINHIVLIANSLITVSCHPDVGFSKNFINNTIGAQANAAADALGKITLPDIQLTQDCIISAVSEFRNNVSVDTAGLLQTKITDCLNKLADDTKNVLAQVVVAGFDPYKSDFVVDPSIQFTTKPIVVAVTLNESSGKNMASKLPADVGLGLASKLTGSATLGHIGSFSYDGESQFVAQIASKLAGNGTVKVAFDNQFISILDNPGDVSVTPTVSVRERLYTFVQSPVLGDGIIGERRDEVDVAGESVGGVE